MRPLCISFILLCSSMHLIAQTNVEDFLKEGIRYHDNGKYDKAIEAYKKALEIEPHSPLVHYEIALSYFSKGDYEKTIEHSDEVLEQESTYMLQAYIAKGSALDGLGRTEESIRLFEKAIEQTEPHYLLYYNLGLNYFRIEKLQEAEDNVIKAIEARPSHSSSHLLLATVHHQQRNTIQTLLAMHYFLFLEPNSPRSLGGYQVLQESMAKNVAKDAKRPNTINIAVAPTKDEQFRAAEVMLSLLEASKSLEKNKDKTDGEMFTENTQSFFSLLGELKKEENKGIWWTFYTPFFYALAKSEHLQTYCKYISQSGDENAKQWVADNKDKVLGFTTWLNSK